MVRVATDFGTFEVGESVVYRTRGDPEDRSGTVQPDGVETCGDYRLVLEAQHKPTLITWPKVEHMTSVATAANVGYTSRQEVQDILDGRGFYGQMKLDVHNVAPGVYFYGSPGISASVGPWMQNVWGRFQGPGALHGLGGERAPVNGLWAYYSREHTELDHNAWYFAVELDKEIHVVGGCTDYSGEGGRARRLAEAFLALFPFDVTIRPASDLVDLLVEGYGPFVLSREEVRDAEEGDQGP